MRGGERQQSREVLFERRGAMGLVTLNRPKALNALNHHMIDLLSAQLAEWAAEKAVARIAITGAGERGLCAGGDIVALYEDARSGDGSASARFFRDEYRLNSLIASHPKPIVAIQDGIVLGGGIGISAHASHRVVTERSKLGLPETGIGFVPDVGASWLLSRAPGETGTRIALTGSMVGAADAIHVGLADSYVRSTSVADLLDRLETEEPDEVVAELASDPGPSALAAEASMVDPAFAGGSVTEILAALRALGRSEADALADTIDAKSPLAVAVALDSLHRAKHLASLEEALEMEYRVSCHALTTHDFLEGVRAQVVDKDRKPVWRPSNRDDVTSDHVDAYFAPTVHGSLGLADSTNLFNEPVGRRS